MADEQKEHDSVLNFYIKLFGQLTFGVVTLLIIWQTIARPIIEMNKLNFQALQDMQAKQGEALNALSRVTSDAVRVSENLKETADSMKSTTQVMVQERADRVE